ncbi:TIGR03943 family putative permease subunit [Salsuginibacillus kocurii]|uniref:TIGR03943 family putative permease subunit n=1 Tax=Salsuginibacillus kocurii TaxID=427078 RepID=UPI0003A3B184|nr:TIGR03943 family protein [Salsuginibacillus kocurii]
MMEERKDYSFHAYLRGIILLGFALLKLGMIISGSIQLYIAPTMMPFIYGSTAILFLLGVIQILRSTAGDDTDEAACDCGADHGMSGPRYVQIGIYSIFLLPIALGFVLPDQTLNSSVAENRGVQFGAAEASEPQGEPDDTGVIQAEEGENFGEDTSRAEEYMEDPDGYMENVGEGSADAGAEEHYTVEEYYEDEQFDSYYAEMAEEYEDVDFLDIDEDIFLDMMTMLDQNIGPFEGKEAEIKGFVYREEGFTEDQLVVARFSMTCCIADASVQGLLIESEEAEQFEVDDWVQATGVIEETEYNGHDMPVLKVTNLEPAEEPDVPYVYPSF